MRRVGESPVYCGAGVAGEGFFVTADLAAFLVGQQFSSTGPGKERNRRLKGRKKKGTNPELLQPEAYLSATDACVTR